VLGIGEPPGVDRFAKEMFRSYFQSTGKLPRDPTEQDWKALEYLWIPSTPQKIIELHPEFDRVVVLGIAPQDYTDYAPRGTIDVAGVTDVAGPASIEKGNDYIAAVVKKHPDKFIGFAAVNPRFRGVRLAVKELERAIKELGLSGLKLYPCYDQYSPDDRELAFPIFEKAEELDIPVIVHQAGTTAVDAQLKYAKPLLLDEVGREFRKLKLIIAHLGSPWVDECLLLLMKHPNFYADISYFPVPMTREEILRFLLKCESWGVPLWKLFWASDYPSFEPPTVMLDRLRSVNEEAEKLRLPKIPEKEIESMLGENFARMI
jgi:predicted TIM-barrel fold metal-dependent hydrolase